MATWYLSSSGSDAADGQTPATAWETFAHAESKIDDATVGDGDVILVMADGDYEQWDGTGDQIDIDTNRDVTYIGANDSGVVDGSRPRLVCGSSFDEFMFDVEGNWRRFFGCQLLGGADTIAAFNMALGTNTRFGVVGCDFVGGFTSWAIRANGMRGIAALCRFKDLIGGGIERPRMLGISDCAFINLGGHGIGFLDLDTSLTRCVFSGCDRGVNATGSFEKGFIHACTFDGNDSDGLRTGTNIAGLRRHHISACSFTRNGGFGINVAASGELPISGCFFGTGAWANTSGMVGGTGGASVIEVGTVTGDPMFADPDAADPDYTPRPGSPLIGGGLWPHPYLRHGTHDLSIGPVERLAEEATGRRMRPRYMGIA